MPQKILSCQASWQILLHILPRVDPLGLKNFPRFHGLALFSSILYLLKASGIFDIDLSSAFLSMTLLSFSSPPGDEDPEDP